jgi:hypothetical protein
MVVSTLDEALSLAGFSKQEAASVKKHQVVRSSLDCLTDRELAAGFAFLVKIPAEDVESIFLESMGKEETDSTVQQIVLGDKDGNLDFSTLKLLPAKNAEAMVQTYLNSKPKDALNLSPEEIDLFHGLHKKTATQEQAEEILRQILASRFDAYRQKGLKGIAPYSRGKNNFEPGKELLERTAKLNVANRVSPAFWKYMVEYPNAKPTGGAAVKESYSWINFNINDKPTFSLVHKVSWKQDNVHLMMHRHFYVSRGHNSMQAVGGALPVQDNETLLFIASRTSTDQVSGFGGAAKRVMGSGIMGGKMADNFERLRSAMEKKTNGT